MGELLYQGSSLNSTPHSSALVTYGKGTVKDALDELSVRASKVDDSADWLKSINVIDKESANFGTINTDTGVEETQVRCGRFGFSYVKPNTLYTLSANKVVSGFALFEYRADKSFIKSTVNDNVNNFSVTTSANTKLARVVVYQASSSFTSLDEIKDYDVMLCEGTSTEYVPYSKSNIELTEVISKAIDKGYISTNVFNGKEIMGYFDATSVGTWVTNANYRSYYAKCKPNTTYTISSNFLTDLRVASSVNEPNYTSNSFNKVEWVYPYESAPYTYTTSSDANYIIIYGVDSAYTRSSSDWLQIEEGTAAHEYNKSNTELTEIVDNANGYLPSRNIWDERWTMGTLDDVGNPVSSSSHFRSADYIPIKPNTKYYWAKGCFACYYDSNKTFVSYEYIGDGEIKQTPSNTRYMMFRIGDTAYRYNQIIAESESAIPYEEGVPSNKALADEIANLGNSGYITEGLTYNNSAYVAGGYFKIGRMVVVNLRISSISASNITINGLPSYSSVASSTIVKANIFDTSDANLTMNGTINANGTLTIVNSNSGRTLIVSAMYLS